MGEAKIGSSAADVVHSSILPIFQPSISAQESRIEMGPEMHIRTNDNVVVITGDDAGTSQNPTVGKVLRVLRKEGKVVVQNVNRVYKHLKPSRRNPQGGRLSKEMAIDASNVMLYCTTCRRGVRIGKRITGTGQKERFCKKCGNTLGVLGPVKKKA
jgi:large subunit ribosomal protein L24